MYGIPNPHLDKKIVDRRVDILAKEGIEFVTSTEVGVDIDGNELVENFDAVVICTGATKPRDLPIEGRDLDGIHFAMEFLRANTKSLLTAALTTVAISPPRTGTSLFSGAVTPEPIASRLP